MARLTAADINISWLGAAHLEDLKAAMRSGGDVLNAVNALLQTPEGKAIASEMLNDPDYVPRAQRTPDPEEAAQIAEDEARATAQAKAAEDAANNLVEAPVAPEAPKVFAEEIAQRAARILAEDTVAREIGMTIVRDAQGNVEKVIQDYQATDEEGRPIGRPTHFESNSLVEAVRKTQLAHINAARYGDRVKNNRFKQSASALAVAEKNATAQSVLAESERLTEEAANEKDPAKIKEAVKKTVEAQRQAEQLADEQKRHGALVAQGWMEDHKDDFLPCLASSNIMKEYMIANGLSMTYENLDKTFAAVKHQLPQVERQPATEVTTSVAPVVNPSAATSAAPAAAPASIPPAAPVVTETKPTAQPEVVTPPPTAEAPTSTPAAAPNAQPAARKPGVNGSLPPGTLSAARPSEAPQPTIAETRSELLRGIAKMSGPEYRKKLRDPKYVAKLEAAGIQYK